MILYLSRGEIAEKLNVSLDVVKGYTRLNDFPEPDAMIGRNMGWLPLTIEKWWAEREFDRKQREAARANAGSD
ncbi:transcriptional regulator [Rhodococcus sp. NPDC079359]|uniref:transcriptional regulator n=1 Tax=Rhodococcus sp. NPDC079359 TaxID=3154961 RepID=UPI00344BD3FE